MDFRRFKTPDWLMIGGAAGFLLFGFMDWVTIKRGGITVGSTGHFYSFFWTGVVPWFLVIGAAAITVLLAADQLREEQAPWPLVLLAMTGVAALLLLFRLIFNPLDVRADIDVGRGVGMILSVASGIVAFVGAYLNFTSKGGDIKDLTDLDKLKSSFAKGDSVASDPVAGDTAPPPPPPPPPPPAPAPPVDPAPPPPTSP